MFKILTLNVLKTLTPLQARHALTKALAQRPHLGGLQECDSRQRDQLLAEAGTLVRAPRLRRLLRRRPPFRGYVLGRPLRGGPVVLADADVFRLERLRSVVLTRTGSRPTRATAAQLRERVTGTVHHVLVVHLLAHHDDPAQLDGWREGVAAARAWAESQHGVTCWVLGDTNKNLLRLPPLVSCWTLCRPLPTGPHGGTIDSVYGTRPALDVAAVEVGSDHRAVVATYPWPPAPGRHRAGRLEAAL